MSASEKDDFLSPTITVNEDELPSIDQFRKDHRTAVLVVLFTDLKGSTELAEQRGEIHSQTVRLRHDSMLRQIVERGESGRVLKNIGDSLLCIFAEPTAAVERAVEIQQRMLEYNRVNPHDRPLQVRIGIHLGQVVVEDRVQADVFGRHVNRAARVESLADGGQILLTFPVYDSAHGWLKERNFRWQDHGAYLLKGIDEPIRIYEVSAPGGPGPRPPAGRRLRRRIWLPLSAILLLTSVAALFAWMYGPTQAPLAPRLQVRVMRGKQVFTDLQAAIPLQTQDRLQLIGQTTRPALLSLVWHYQEGKILVVADSSAPTHLLVYPPGKDEWVALEGDPGTEAIVLIAAEGRKTDQRLLLAKLRETGRLSEFDNREPAAAIWLSPDKLEVRQRGVLPGEKPRAPGKIEEVASRNLELQLDRIRQTFAGQATAFHAVAFPHR